MPFTLDQAKDITSFTALLVGGYLVAKYLKEWLEKVHTLLSEIKNNHLAHIQQSMMEMTENSKDANKKLDAQSQMLGVIVQQTKKD